MSGAQFGGFGQLAGTNISANYQIVSVLADSALEGTTKSPNLFAGLFAISAELRRKDLTYSLLAFASIIIVGFVLWFVLKNFATSPRLVGILLGLSLVIAVLRPVRRFGGLARKFSRGASGERVVSTELRQLSDEFSIFEDVTIPGRHGNVDFVVVGPTGIFALEVKAHGGTIDYNGFTLTINGRELREGKNFLHQTYGESRTAQFYLQGKVNAQLYVKPILVFSHAYAHVQFGLQPVQKVVVAHRTWLRNVLDTGPNYDYRGTRAKIEQELQNLCMV